MDYKKIKPPKIKRREVVYLTAEEIQQFVSSIKLENSWDGNVRKRCVRLDGLRFRTLVEVLLGTGMRISEALSLNRDSINFEKGEAKIIGKGNKERTVYFTDRSLEWIRYYLENRQDDNPALFLNQRGEPLNRGEADFLFMRYGKKSGINKKISPHTIRHSFATLLLQNGCPVGHLKELLGHTDLQVTCKYYLGIISKAEVKQAHSKYLNF